MHALEPPPRPRPLLASEALCDELAPAAPLASQVRGLCATAALVLLVCGAAIGIHAPSGRSGAIEGTAAALLVLVVAWAPLPYAARAHALTALGVGLLLAALFGHGPAGALVDPASGTSFAWEVARVLAALLLPAALLLRAHYRAFPRTRVLLGWGLALALPFVIRSAYLVLLAPRWSERIAAGSAIGSVLFALLGFMGSHTTAGGSLWASCLLGSLALDVAARLFLPGEAAHSALHLATALSFLASAGLGAFGLFQTLAHAIGPDARRDIEARHRRRGLASAR